MAKRIEFGELRVGATARAHIQDCLDRNWVTAGVKVAQFERDWSELFKYRHSKAVSSGTDACINMCLALRTLGVAKTEIITPALSFIATAHAIRAAGFTPVFVDIDRRTLNIDPEKIEAAITPNTAAIMVVHTMGRPCDMRSVMTSAERHNLPVLEDCCEAHGASYRGGYVGSFGAAAAFSFYIAHLICCGEGGMVSTNRDDIAAGVTSTRSHGRRNGELYFDFPHFGLNSKMTDLAASLGLEGVSNFWSTFWIRHRNMMLLHERLHDYKNMFWASEQDMSNVNCPHGYSLTLRDEALTAPFQSCLDTAGIHWKRNFGSIPTHHASFCYLGHKLGDFPEAEYVGRNGIHIGLHQYLTTSDIDHISTTLIDFFRTHKGHGQ